MLMYFPWFHWHFENNYDCLYLHQCPWNQGKHRADTAVATTLSDKKLLRF
jgi:hypothetical protein